MACPGETRGAVFSHQSSALGKVNCADAAHGQDAGVAVLLGDDPLVIVTPAVSLTVRVLAVDQRDRGPPSATAPVPEIVARLLSTTVSSIIVFRRCHEQRRLATQGQ